MRIIAIAQQKGGTGKSTTAQAIGAGLSHRGQRVLFVDLDPQGNLTYVLGADQSKATALDVLTGKVTAYKAAQAMNAGELPGMTAAAVIPGSPYLAGADATITGTGREYRLAEALKTVTGAFDVCIVDTPPALGILTVNALTAADDVIIPCLADVFSIQALGQIADTVAGIKANCNPRLKISGILLTRYTPRQNLTKDTADILGDAARKIGTRLFNTRIRETVSLREAQAMGKDIFSYNPRSAGAEDYNALIEEIF
ncbi:MAG: ParA family protein [Oscillospiraceae bacterium]|nr:ParA family protein [Oscillospiraceae bacterium]